MNNLRLFLIISLTAAQLVSLKVSQPQTSNRLKKTFHQNPPYHSATWRSNWQLQPCPGNDQLQTGLSQKGLHTDQLTKTTWSNSRHGESCQHNSKSSQFHSGVDFVLINTGFKRQCKSVLVSGNAIVLEEVVHVEHGNWSDIMNRVYHWHLASCVTWSMRLCFLRS